MFVKIGSLSWNLVLIDEGQHNLNPEEDGN